MIHLYRHADAGKRCELGWPRPGPPPRRTGLSRSPDWSPTASPQRAITRILTSPYLRCVQSVEPLSEATGIPIEIEPRLAEHSDPEPAMALLTEVEAGTVLCSHGDIVSAIVGRIAAEGAALDGDLVWAEGSIWHLEPGPGRRVATATYEPPPVTFS